MSKLELILRVESFIKLIQKGDCFEKRRYLTRFQSELEKARNSGTISPLNHRKLLKKAASLSL